MLMVKYIVSEMVNRKLNMRKIIYISIISFFVLGLSLEVSAKRKK